MISTNIISAYMRAIVELVVGIGDGVAETAAREDELAGDDADEGIGERELAAGEQIGRGGGQDDAQDLGARLMRCMRASLSNTRGTRSRPLRVAITIAVTPNMNPIATSGTV